VAFHRMSHPLVIALFVVGTLVGFAGPASAYHSVLSGQVVCTGGQQIVTWTIANSEGTSDTGRSMTIDEISVSSGTVTGVETGTVFPPLPLPGSTQTATTVLPGTQTGNVKLTVQADWDRGGWQDIVRTVKVELPGDCRQPPVPSAEIASACPNGPVITFTNEGDGTVVFTLTRDGAPNGTVEVGPFSHTTRSFALSEDATSTFAVSAPGMEPVTATINLDCEAVKMIAPTTTTTTIAPKVLGEQLVQPAPAAVLPRTGFGGVGLALAGLGLVGAGLPLVRLRRRHR
jgi:hypothetical protein